MSQDTYKPPIHCCVCVNLSKPPWREAIAMVDGYCGCAQHVQLLATHPSLGWALSKVSDGHSATFEARRNL